ncbi:MAG TPA: 50S ribosomal protein L17, partial [Candidatus Limnocylindria bacterium]
FTRITRLPRRVGDSAPMMLIELMPGVAETTEPEAEAKPKRRLALPRRKTTAAASAGDEKPAAKRTKKTAAKKAVKAKA